MYNFSLLCYTNFQIQMCKHFKLQDVCTVTEQIALSQNAQQISCSMVIDILMSLYVVSVNKMFEEWCVIKVYFLQDIILYESDIHAKGSVEAIEAYIVVVNS